MEVVLLVGGKWFSWSVGSGFVGRWSVVYMVGGKWFVGRWSVVFMVGGRWSVTVMVGGKCGKWSVVSVVGGMWSVWSVVCGFTPRLTFTGNQRQGVCIISTICDNTGSAILENLLSF